MNRGQPAHAKVMVVVVLAVRAIVATATQQHAI
jgi:hypothetical protein